MKMAKMEKDHPRVLLPVEALVAHRNALYYSQGSHLLLQNSEQTSLHVCTFPHHIHLLKSLKDTLYIAAGSKLYKLFKDDCTAEEVDLPFPDRILDLFIHEQNLYCITAHAHLYNLTTSLVYTPPEHLLIFSGCIGMYDGTLTIALGTIFSGVLLTRIVDDKMFIYKPLQGHKGSVFGIAMSNDVIASVSDDRNLLIYKRDGNGNPIKCTHHDARIWRVMLQGASFVATVGEDSRCCVWSASTGKLLSSFKHCSGRAGMTSLTTDSAAIIVGCHDGSIVRWPVSEIGKAPTISVYPTKELEVKNFCILDESVIVVTNDGGVYLEGTRIYQHIDLASYTVLHPCTATNTLLIGTKHGTVHSLTKQGSCTIVNFHEKIGAIFTAAQHTCIQTTSYAIVTLGDLSNPVWRLETIATAFAVIDDIAIIGDRNGWMHSRAHPKLALNRRNDAITCIELVNDCIRVIDRSGLLTVLDGQTFAIISQTRPLTDATIERAQGDLLFGFRQKHFFVHSLNEDHTLYQVFCAGQHRRWQLCLEHRIFAFLREGRIHTTPIDFTRKEVLRVGGHQREIRDALVLSEALIVTAGEDNDVLIIDVTSNTLHKQPMVHTSGIKCIKRCRERVFTAGGGNEVWEWQFMLGDNDGTPRLMPIRNLDALNELDCRILSVDVKDPEGLILTGSSDGQVRVYDDATGNRAMHHATLHGDNCVQHVRWHSGHAFITAGSDGCICCATTRLALSTLRIHQSGINCLAIVEEGDAKFVVTGGDDQRLSICRLADNHLSLLAQVQAHSSAVNGVDALFHDGYLFILSVALDRRMALHRYDLHGKGMETIKRFGIDVADAAVLKIFSHDSTSIKVFIGGVGYGIYDVCLADE